MRLIQFITFPRKNFSPPPGWGGGEIFSGDTWKVRCTNQIRTGYRNWRTISARQLQPSKSLLHPVYLNMVRREQLCTDAGGNHLQHLLRFILVFNQLDAQNLFHSKFYFMPLHVSSTCDHHQEVKIALYSLWYHQTYRCAHVLETCRGMK